MAVAISAKKRAWLRKVMIGEMLVLRRRLVAALLDCRKSFFRQTAFLDVEVMSC